MSEHALEVVKTTHYTNRRIVYYDDDDDDAECWLITGLLEFIKETSDSCLSQLGRVVVPRQGRNCQRRAPRVVLQQKLQTDPLNNY